MGNGKTFQAIVKIIVAIIGAAAVIYAALINGVFNGLRSPATTNSSNTISNDVKVFLQQQSNVVAATDTPVSSKAVPTYVKIDEACIVPLLELSSQAVAEGLISQLGLQVVKTARYDAKVASGLVLSSDPPSGTKLSPCKGEVIIVISLGLTPTPVRSTSMPIATLTHTPLPIPSTTPIPTSISLEGEWDFKFHVYRQLLTSGVTQNVSDDHPVIIKLSQNGTRLTGEVLGGSMCKAEIVGQIVDGQVQWIFNYRTECCKGAKIQLNGVFDFLDSIKGKLIPVGASPENCIIWWADAEGTKR